MFVRDRFTWLTYLQLATYGYFLYAFTPSVTLLRDDEHVSSGVSGLHGTGLAVGAVVAGVALPRLAARLGRARLMRIALAILCVGVVGFVSCDVVAVTIGAAVVGGFGGCLIVNLSASMLTTHHAGPNGGAAYTEANGLAACFGIFAPLLISAAIALKLGWRAGMLVAVVLIVVITPVFGRGVRTDHDGPPPPHARIVKRRMSREFWRACGVLVMTTAIEFSMTIWSSDVLESHDGLSKAVAAIGVTAIVAGMTLGRLASGKLAQRHSADVLLMCAFGTTLVGFAAFWASPFAWLAFVGLFLTGLGIALHFPLATTRLIGFSEGHADLATGYASRGTGVAIGLAPFGLGALADHVGSHTAMLIVPIFIALAALGVATTRRPPTSEPHRAAPIAVGDLPATIE